MRSTARGKDQAKDDAANPLMQGGLKLIPSVTRVFSVDRPMYIYLQAYEREEAGIAHTEESAATPATPLFA